MFEKINKILSVWNPIELDDQLAQVEYQIYIPAIIEAMESQTELFICLKDILINKLGLDFTPSNEAHVNELIYVSKKLMQVYNE